MATRSFAAMDHVPETRFGTWFLGTEIWVRYVLQPAIEDLARLLPAAPQRPVLLDIGCGSGRALELLRHQFSPSRLIAVDSDAAMLQIASDLARQRGVEAEFLHGAAGSLPLPDASADMIFCHQTFHHLVDQPAALGEFRRVLKPGGLLLMAESTRRYIHSWIIRLLFRHDMSVQRSAEEYLAMVRQAGFVISPAAISYPYLWWSRPDLGLLEHVFGRPPKSPREETLLNLVAQRP